MTRGADPTPDLTRVEREQRLDRRTLLQAGSLVLLLGRAQIASGATILAVRVWPAPDYTRITLESDTALKARPFFISSPPRLAVDIEGIDLDPALRDLVAKVRADDPFIAGIRAGQYAPGLVRLVVDLKQAALPQVFSLPPVAAYSHRLVLDLYPAQAADPLQALVAERLRERQAAEASRPSGRLPPSDPIAELIAQQNRRGGAPQAAQAAPSLPPSPAPAAQGMPAPLGSSSPARLPYPIRPPLSDAGTGTAAAPQRFPTVPNNAISSFPAPPPGMPARQSSQAAVEQAAAAQAAMAQAAAPQPLPQPAPQSAAQQAALPQPAPSSQGAEAAAPDRGNRTERLIIVALDPGHGGEDPGAIGPAGTREKDVVLQIAHRVQARINAGSVNGNSMRAFLTRDADFFVPLGVRVQKAQRVQADLFVSIHADAFYTPQARGASVFALSEGAATSSAARWIADKENKADAVGGLNVATKDAHVRRALIDMSTTAQIRDSIKLAGAVLGEIGGVGRLHKPHVEQAGFAVLKAPDIPSVLIETAFISNPEEEARLRSEAYQDKLADAIMRGIEHYFARNPPLARNRVL